MSVGYRVNDVGTDLDQPGPTDASTPTWYFGARSSRLHLSQKNTSVLFQEGKAKCGMTGEVKTADVQKFVKGVMKGVGRHVEHVHGLLANVKFIGNCRRNNRRTMATSGG